MDNVEEIVEKLRPYFMEKEECFEIQQSNASKFANDDTRIKLFEQKMIQWEWLFKLIATGTIGTLVTSVLALILK